MPRPYTSANLRTLAGDLGAALPAPRKRRNIESMEQQRLIRWWGQHCGEFGVPYQLLMSIPNGGRRDKITGVFMKREGARAGAPDLLMAVARDGFHALFIEMKTADGVLRADQLEMLKALEAQGYLTEVCRSFEDAKVVITNYLKP